MHKPQLSIKRQISGLGYFLLGLLVFIILGIDNLALKVDSSIIGYKISPNNYFSSPWYILFFHCLCVILLWLTVVYIVNYILKKKNYKIELFDFKFDKSTVLNLIIAFILGCGIMLLDAVVKNGEFHQLIIEYKQFSKLMGVVGISSFSLQCIYYLAETFMVLLILTCIQTACEKWFKFKYIPYGAIGVVFTWGLGNVIGRGLESILWVSALALVANILYIVNKKQIYPVYLFIFMSFLL